MRVSSALIELPSIPSGFIPQMVAHLDLQGLNKNTQARIAQLNQQDKVSIAHYSALYSSLVIELEDEMIGFLDRPVPIGSIGVLCEMLQYCPDIPTAIDTFERFYRLFVDADKPFLQLTGFTSTSRIVLCNPTSTMSQPMYQQVIVMMLIKICSWLAGRKLDLARLDFGFDAMPFDEEFQFIFDVVPTYGNASTALQFAPNAMAHKVAPKESAAAFSDDFITKLLYRALQDDICRLVYAEISARLAYGRFDIESIAADFNVSKQTLSRRLKTSGSAYSTILQAVRTDKAKVWLNEGKLSLEQISERLGFAEFGSFSRAFKSWTGLNPSSYR